MFWAHLGGLHMNIHKLLENALFECELYLGYALLFGNTKVRLYVEANLGGCYQKRRLEAARFLWIDGAKHILRQEYAQALETLRTAASQKEGWGWAVNHGEIWIAQAAATILLHGTKMISNRNGGGNSNSSNTEGWVDEVKGLLEKNAVRCKEARSFGASGTHPWAGEIQKQMSSYQNLGTSGETMADWLEEHKRRTIYWCTQVLSGSYPFPPRPKPRLEDAVSLVRRLPGHNAIDWIK